VNKIASTITGKTYGSNQIFSSALVDLNDNAKLQVSVDKAKITTITGDMYLSALKSAGITSGHVYVTSPVTATGESALAGIMNSYEVATNVEIPETVKEAANNEIYTQAEVVQNSNVSSEKVSKLVDDVKEVQANVDLVNGFTNRMAIAFSNTKDAYINGIAVTNAGTKLHSDSAQSITKDNVWAEVCKLHEVLARKNAITKNGLDYEGKRPALVITPEFQGILLQCSNFFANAFGDKVLRTGQIGHIGAFDVFLDTNIQTVKTGTGTGASYSQTIVALTSDAITYAEQITKT
jgi:hypothetical protein